MEWWGPWYCWCHLSSFWCSSLRIWYWMLSIWLILHWHPPNFSAGLSPTMEPATGCRCPSRGSKQQAQGYAPTAQESISAQQQGFMRFLYTEKQRDPVCKATLNLFAPGCSRPQPKQVGQHCTGCHNPAAALGFPLHALKEDAFIYCYKKLPKDTVDVHVYFSSGTQQSQYFTL